MRKIILIIPLLLSWLITTAQSIHPDILNKKWNAFWIAVPGESAEDYGVYAFRKIITLSEKPSKFIVHVSGDNRYKLFVNNKLVSLGPARGDIFHWNFETVNIAPFLNAGENCISAIVWNFGKLRPVAQISNRTGFIVQGNTHTEEIINTDKTWKCIRDESYEPLPPDLLRTYYVSGPGEKIDFNKHLINWNHLGYHDESWKPADQLTNGLPKGVFDWSTGWMLVPRSIPPMELTTTRFASIRKTENITVGLKNVATNNPEVTFQVPPNKKILILFDQGHLTNAYPALTFSKGKHATIRISYAEALYVIENTADWKTQRQKGNRNEIDGKRFVGVSDQLISSGATSQSFTSLWWRTYRYVQLEIQTKEEGLTIDDFYGVQTGYPFQMTASFNAENSELDKIFETGWRTSRLCAVETYMDCPYYEQLQYVGDTRIQALVSVFNAGDDRLMRNAITLLDHSRMAEGITLSRYPASQPQQIPPFALWWIGMIHDFWMYRNDHEFVKSKLPGIRQVLSWFSVYQQSDGSLKNTPYWNFSDWATGPGWERGVAPIGSDGSSAALDLQLCWAYSLAAKLEASLGLKELASHYQSSAVKLQKTIRTKYWDPSKMLFADDVDKKFFSQHTNTLSILAGVTSGNDTQILMENILRNGSMTKATIYFKYYMHQALVKAGLGNRYLELLQDWQEQLANGLTTWAEISDYNNARSDCHAWGASPNVEFFRIVLGIDSDAPGFEKIRIEPHLGKLTKARGTIPHPNGSISVNYSFENEKWHVEILLPKNTTGKLIWSGKEFELLPDKNSFTF